MTRPRRSRIGDACLCMLAASTGAVGTALGREYLENPYFAIGVYFPETLALWASGAAALAWAIVAVLYLRSRRSLPLGLLLASQVGIAVFLGLLTHLAEPWRWPLFRGW